MKNANNNSKVRKNVQFFNCSNGNAEFFAEGKEITLGNGNEYAITDEGTFRIESDEANSEYIPVK